MGEWVCRPGIVLAKICDVYLLVADREAMKECRYVRQINEIGASIWNQLKEGKSQKEICTFIRKEYDVPADCNLKEDVNKFLSALSEGHYILEKSIYCAENLQPADGSAQ